MIYDEMTRTELLEAAYGKIEGAVRMLEKNQEELTQDERLLLAACLRAEVTIPEVSEHHNAGTA